MKKIVTCTGYGTTGSSVVTDLLKEFKNVKSFGDYEFRFLFDPQGIRNLESGLFDLNNRQNSDFYIKEFKEFIRYLSKSKMYNYYGKVFNNQFDKILIDFVESLVDVKWDGYWHRDVMKENNIRKFFYYLERVIQKKILNQKAGSARFYRKEMYYSFPASREEFQNKVKNSMNKLIEATRVKEEVLVFDQLVPPENNEDYLEYFDNLKIIIVDRDPRDLFLLEKYEYKEKFGPYMDVKKFVKWHRLIRKHREKELVNTDRVMNIYFEDFIYDYEKTVYKIMNFLEISNEDWKEKKKYFNPEKSRRNTKKWLEYKENKIIMEEIKYIEKELKEYLYEKI